MRIAGLLAALAIFCAGAAVPASAAQSVADFYRGKVVSLYIGYSVGAGYDAHGRLVARHLGKYIPGRPTVIPVNMEGAGSLKLTNWLYNVPPKDGTVIGIIARGAPFEPLLGVAPSSARFDGRKFTWIGSTTDEVSVCVAWERAGIDRFDQLYRKQLIVGASGGDPEIYPRVLNAVLGTKFRVVNGYPGGAEIDFAMERGEVDGRCGWSWNSIVSSNKSWLDEGKIKILVQLSLRQDPELTARGVPWIMDLAKTDEQRQLFRLFFLRGSVGRPFLGPPGIPADRATALRKAFMDAMKDPQLLAEAKRGRLEITPLSGEEAQELIEDVYNTPRPLIRKARAMIGLPPL